MMLQPSLLPVLQRNEKVGDVSKESELSAGILLLDADGSYGSGSPGGASSKLYYTEMHIDVFRIVHEQAYIIYTCTCTSRSGWIVHTHMLIACAAALHMAATTRHRGCNPTYYQVELAMATTMEPLVFNALLSAADFLTDVQNELLQRIRSQWQALGFLYLFAAINNAARCAELWADVLAASHRESRSDGCGLGEALGAQLHLDYVSEGFCNLANAAVQLACRRIVMQLEPSLVSSM